ncbi:MAG: helix-turn-helix domain-containing protein [Myxococcales bacterium]|nr:helix-turn-helix domain-containing protein [Myxococcales bacterium]
MGFVALPGVQLVDVVGPLEVFDAANRLLQHRGQEPAYTLRVVGLGSRIRSASGLEICTQPLADAPSFDSLVIAGHLGMARQTTAPSTLEDVRRLTERAERVVSVCAGAFVLADLGLLDGRRCTTHWLALRALRRRAPAAQVEQDTLFTCDPATESPGIPVFTSAGALSGVDLALHLLERDLGSEVALEVARLLVVFLRRTGGQSQFGASQSLQPVTDQRLRELVASVVTEPGADHSVGALAKRMAMSPRHFSRVFRKQTGQTPAAFVSRVRVDAARLALEASDHTTARIAHDCGFGTEETLRRAFHRTVGVSPTDYRRRFHRT